MAIVASNGLNGPNNVQPTLGDLAGTGTTPTFLDNTGLLYSNAQVIRGRNSLRMRTNFHQGNSGRFSFDLPEGPWTLRFYMYAPSLGNTVDRWHLASFGDRTLVHRQSGGGNVSASMGPTSTPGINYDPADAATGVSVPIGQLLRMELMYDPSTEVFEQRVFAGDDTTTYRGHVFNDQELNGAGVTFSGYRWTQTSILQLGDDDSTTGGQVTPLQEQLLVWDPNSLPEFGADGDYGNETATAVSNFQSDMGITVTGAAGPETRTALTLYERLDNDPNDYPGPYWIGNLVITDELEWIGPLDTSTTDLTVGVEFGSQVVAEDTTVYAQTDVAFGVEVGETFKSVDSSVEEGVTFGVESIVTKAMETDASTGVEFGVDVVHTATSFIPDPPPLAPTFRLAIYNANAFSVASDDLDGSLRGYIYRPLNVQVSSVFNDAGSMTFSIPEESPEVQYITGDGAYDEFFEVGFELMTADGTDYVEPPNMRFYAMRREFDEADRAGIISWSLLPCSWVFRCIRPDNVGQLNGVWAARFTDVRPSDIILGYLNQYEVEFGSNEGVAINWNFTSSTDSSGASWTGTPFDIEYPVNAMLDNTLNTFAEQRNVDWRFLGREFQLFLPDTVMNQDLSGVGPGSVYLRGGRDMLEARNVISYEHRRARVSVYGSNFWTLGTGGDIITPYGGGHDITVATGITSPHPLISQISNARRQETRTTNRGVYRRFACRRMDQVPLRDYNPGDRIRVQTRTPGRGYEQTDFESLRIREIVLSAGADRILECTMTLEYRFLPKDVLLQRQQHVITGGSPSRGAGTWNRTFGP